MECNAMSWLSATFESSSLDYVGWWILEWCKRLKRGCENLDGWRASHGGEHFCTWTLLHMDALNVRALGIALCMHDIING